MFLCGAQAYKASKSEFIDFLFYKFSRYIQANIFYRPQKSADHNFEILCLKKLSLNKPKYLSTFWIGKISSN